MTARRLGGAIIAIFLLAGTAAAQQAAPPLGAWQGNFHDGSGSLTLTVSGSGSFYIHVTGGRPITGSWTWTPSARGGIITLHHVNGGAINRLYYSVTYIDGRSVLFSDPWFKVVLYRQ